MMTWQTDAEASPPVIAVVDDDEAVSRSLKFSLELDGFDVRTFSGGAELLGARDIAACRCFVVDQKMPGMTGLELIGRLRDRNIAAPAILIISHPSMALSTRAANAGVPLVEKPLLGDTLLESIRAALARAP
jgi:FixJ family two-component response regulator